MGNPVVHFDISGPDADQLKSFYGPLLGWKIDTQPDMGGYALIDTQGGAGVRGGIGPAREGPGQVTFYVWSEDLQATLDRAESLGGTVTQPVLVMPGVVTLAMFADPAGNQIGLVGATPETEGQENPPPSAGAGAPVTWFEVMGPDVDALVSFYTQLFGWTAKEYDIPGEIRYVEADSGEGGIKGGIGSNPMGVAYATVYAEPSDLQAALDQAEQMGAKTIVPVSAMPGGPTIAMFADPQGHPFGIYKRA